MSFAFYSSILVLMNIFVYVWYNKSDTYIAHMRIYKCFIAINLLCVYFVGGFFVAELYFLANGRALHEIILELLVDPFPPRFRLYSNWRENLYVVFGTWSTLTALALPYFYGPVLTGLEFSFVPLNRDASDFLGEQVGMIKEWWYKGKKPLVK